jgi:UDP-4-amino-4,6-dideoxy-N-acetyl-beta-L-altrosamine transaminase
MAIPYGRQAIDEDDVAAVAAVLRGDWLTQGPAVAEFESSVATACEARHAVAFSSGTAALHGAAFAAGLGPGDTFATSAITFAASANCGVYLGATPRFADVERDTWNVSADTLRAVAGGVKCVIPVHFTGLPAPIAEIRAAVGEDVVLIEDAAHALGAWTEDEPVGACRHSDMAIFSFHPVKAVTSGEGGIVTTQRDDLAERLRLFRSHGITRSPELERDEGPWHQEQHELGFNYRLTDIHSALGVSQMSKLERFVEARNAVATRYRDWLSDVDQLELPPAAPDGQRHAYHLFVVRHRDGSDARRALYDGLREREIYPQVHYLPVYLHPYYRRHFGFAPGECPEAERYYDGCLSLPCFPTLSEPDQERVVVAIREVLGA